MKRRASRFRKILKFALLSVIMTVILCVVFAVMVRFLHIEAGTARTAVFVIMIFSVLAGAFLLAKSVRRSGLVNGFLMAAAYFIALVLISVILKGKFSFSLDSFTQFVVLAAAGMLGGIVGVNR